MKGAVKASQLELSRVTDAKSTWHADYRSSAYIICINLNKELNEGDISTVFSQYGEIADLKLVKDRKTGDSRGIAFICYEDQRSTDLAVDNFNGVNLCGRRMKVDHVQDYVLKDEGPRRDKRNVVRAEEEELKTKIFKPSGPDGRFFGQFRQFDEDEVLMFKQKFQKEIEAQLQKEMKTEKQARAKKREIKIVADENERWEQMFMANQKSKEIRNLKGELENIQEQIEERKKRLKNKKKKRIKKKQK